MNTDHYTRARGILDQSQTLCPAGELTMEVARRAGDIGRLWNAAFPSGSAPDLSGADFTDCTFAGGQKAELNGANFTKANLKSTRWLLIAMKDADFKEANLQGARMLGVFCDGTSFRNADLTNAVLTIQRGDRPIDFSYANLTGATLDLYTTLPLTLTGANVSGLRIIGSGAASSGPLRSRAWKVADFQAGVTALLASLDEKQRQQVRVEQPKPEGGCFVATAVCGSETAPEVVALRSFRDEVLLPAPYGPPLVQTYYFASPPIARWLARRAWARRLTRAVVVRPLAAWARSCVDRLRRLERPTRSAGRSSRIARDL
jgi:pentapeptide repeat protein